MANLNNPAGRLRYWLEDLAGSAPGGNAILVAWQQILGFHDVDLDDEWTPTSEVLRHAGVLASQCVEVRQEALALPEAFSPELLLEDFHEVEDAVRLFTGMTQHRLETQLAAIEPTGHRALKILDTYLASNRPQGSLDESTLEDLAKRVNFLLAELDGHPDLNQDTKDFIRVRFTDVRQALGDASVIGPRTVERSVEALLGSIQRQPAYWQRIGESTLANVVGGLIVALVVAIGTQPSRQMLPPGTPEHVLIENHVRVNVGQSAVDDAPGDEVVDAEIVEEPDDPRRGGKAR